MCSGSAAPPPGDIYNLSWCLLRPEKQRAEFLSAAPSPDVEQQRPVTPQTLLLLFNDKELGCFYRTELEDEELQGRSREDEGVDSSSSRCSHTHRGLSTDNEGPGGIEPPD